MPEHFWDGVAEFLFVEKHWYPLAGALLLLGSFRRFRLRATGMSLGDTAAIVSIVAAAYLATVFVCLALDTPGAVECLRQQHGFFLLALAYWIPLQTWRDCKKSFWPNPPADDGLPPPPGDLPPSAG